MLLPEGSPVYKCVKCHKAPGVSWVDNVPRLTGQNKEYLKKQLANFKSKKRTNTLLDKMNRVAAGLTDEEVEMVTTHYSTLNNNDFFKKPEPLLTDMDIDLEARGKAISKFCFSCHGLAEKRPAIVPDWPVLSGQNQEALLSSFGQFISGKRQAPQMRFFSEGVLNYFYDSFAIAFYLSRKTPPKPNAYFTIDPENPEFAIDMSNDRKVLVGESPERAIKRCVACHEGSSELKLTKIPHLAQQNVIYLKKQLLDFKNHLRKDTYLEVMPKMVESFTEEDLDFFAQEFSEKKLEKTKKEDMTQEDQQAFEIGKKMIESKQRVLVEDPVTRVNCEVCHLSNSEKNAPKEAQLRQGFPTLTGQKKDYIINQLKAYQRDERTFPIMNADQVGPLNDEELNALATYFQFLNAE